MYKSLTVICDKSGCSVPSVGALILHKVLRFRHLIFGIDFKGIGNSREEEGEIFSNVLIDFYSDTAEISPTLSFHLCKYTLRVIYLLSV